MSARLIVLGIAFLGIMSVTWLATTQSLVHGASFTVNSTIDAVDANPGDGVCDDGVGNCTLRAAIMESNALPGTDTITISAGTYTLAIAGTGEDAAATGDLDITQNLIIVGAGQATTIIDGGALDRVIHIGLASGVQMSNLTVQNGNLDGNGGGIFNSGGLTLIDSTVTANSVPAPLGTYGEGGGIYNDTGAILTITNSTISNNSVSSRGYGGGILNRSSVTITGSIISGNVTGSDNSDAGGGISVLGPDSTLTVTDSNIISNTASGSGGGIDAKGTGAVTLSNSTFSGNTAGRHGGAIYNFLRLTVTDSTFDNNTAGSNGGAIYVHDLSPSVIISGSTFSRNTSLGTGVDAGGGGIDFRTRSSEKRTITNSTFSDNTANNHGGGIFANSGEIDGTVTLSNSTLSGNTAVGAAAGGGIYILIRGKVELINTIVANSFFGGDCGGVLPTSLGHNLDTDSTCNLTAPDDLTSTNPLLGPLQNNGGLTETHALLPGSPAIAHIPAADCADADGDPVTTDQRGVIRPQGVGCDIGAYELVQNAATCTLALSYIGTDLNFDYVIGTPEPATLNAWFVIQSDGISFVTAVPTPAIDPPVPVPFTIPAFPQLETIGVLTTINTAAEGIICHSFATVDTGPTTLSPEAATEELRKRFAESRRALPDG